MPGAMACVRPLRAAVLRTMQVPGVIACRLHHVFLLTLSDTGAANAGAATSAAAPRRRGYSVAATGRMSVSAAAGVSARSASAARTVGFNQVPRQRDFAADIDARRIEHVDHRGEAEAEIARRGIERRRRLGIARPRARNQVFHGEVPLLDARRAR